MRCLLLFLIFVALLGSGIHARVERGQIRVLNNTQAGSDPGTFVFLGKFAFDEGNAGTMSYELTNVDGNRHVLLMYDDGDAWFRQIYPAVENQQVGDCGGLIDLARWKEPLYPAVNGITTGRLHIDDHSTPRYWFAVLANCYSGRAEDMSVNYELTLLNGDFQFTQQFGADENGIWIISMIFVVLYVGGTLIFVLEKLLSINVSEFRGLNVWMLLVWLLETGACILSFLHWTLFMLTGYSSYISYLAASLMDEMANILFVIALFLGTFRLSFFLSFFLPCCGSCQFFSF